jgi:hypothetical protein
MLIGGGVSVWQVPENRMFQLERVVVRYTVLGAAALACDHENMQVLI